MPTEMTAPRISSNMAPSQPVAGVEIEAAHGEEAEANREKDDVQHLGSPKRPGRVERASRDGPAASPLRRLPPVETDLGQSPGFWRGATPEPTRRRSPPKTATPRNPSASQRPRGAGQLVARRRACIGLSARDKRPTDRRRQETYASLCCRPNSTARIKGPARLKFRDGLREPHIKAA